jgi:hypothetical protein
MTLIIANKASGKPFNRFLVKIMLYLISLLAFGEKAPEKTPMHRNYLHSPWY